MRVICILVAEARRVVAPAPELTKRCRPHLGGHDNMVLMFLGLTPPRFAISPPFEAESATLRSSTESAGTAVLGGPNLSFTRHAPRSVERQRLVSATTLRGEDVHFFVVAAAARRGCPK
jgi:hypothetical protein